MVVDRDNYRSLGVFCIMIKMYREWGEDCFRGINELNIKVCIIVSRIREDF